MVDRLANTDANRQRIETVEKCFGTSGIRLLLPGRVLVGEGILTKICRKKPKKRQFYLFNDIMVYGNIIINKKKYIRQHIIPLEGVTIEDKNEPEKFGWLIKTPTKSFAVYATSESEKSEWISHINRCIDELLRRTGKAAPYAHAAVWIPDTETNQCMHCKQSHFTLINRRHHCRNCGFIICGNCSKNKFMIASQSSKPVRVCDSCFRDLCEKRVSTIDSKRPWPVPALRPTKNVDGSPSLINVDATAPTSISTENCDQSQATDNHSDVKNINNTDEKSDSLSQAKLVDTSAEEENVSAQSEHNVKNVSDSALEVKSDKLVSHFAPVSDEQSTLRKQDSETQETDDSDDDEIEENSPLDDASNCADISTAPVFYDDNNVATQVEQSDRPDEHSPVTAPEADVAIEQAPKNQ